LAGDPHFSGYVSRGKLDILRKADAMLLEGIRHAALYGAIWQAFAVLLPARRSVLAMPAPTISSAHCAR
jgi:GMP synthase (glutamine-hydrolysing)